MLNGFRQGIISYPHSDSLQTFLSRSGNNISLNVSTSTPVDYTIAQGSSDYYFSETVQMNAAWISVPTTDDVWLYFDINLRSGIRTFGITLIQPIAQPTAPTNPLEDQHWFDTVNYRHYVRTGGVWVEVLRVFAGKVNNTIFSPLGNISGAPYAGSQIGSYGIKTVDIGRVIFDDTGLPIRKQSGEFFTTTTEVFTDSSLVNTVRVEASVLEAQAIQNLSSYQVVKYTNFNKVEAANYNDTQTTAIAITLNSATINSIATLCIQGVVTNPSWQWTTVGAPLWIQDGGGLTDQDPNLTDPTNHIDPKAPVARVLSQNQIFFDQGLGSRGPRGIPGISPSVNKASNSVIGTTLLSVQPANVEFPIAVGDNDPRLSGPRPPLAHTHPPTDIVMTPIGDLQGANLADMMLELDQKTIDLGNSKLDKTGGVVLGSLSSNAPITSPLQYVTKQYVDSSIVPIQVPQNSIAYGTSTGGLTGVSSYQFTPLSVTTTDASVTLMTRTGTSLVGINIPANSIVAFEGTIVGRSTGGNVIVTKFNAACRRDTTTNSLVLLGTIAPTIIYTDGISQNWSTDVIADTSAGVLTFRVKGGDHTTVKWVGNIITSLVTI